MNWNSILQIYSFKRSINVVFCNSKLLSYFEGNNTVNWTVINCTENTFIIFLLVFCEIRFYMNLIIKWNHLFLIYTVVAYWGDLWKNIKLEFYLLENFVPGKCPRKCWKTSNYFSNQIYTKISMDVGFLWIYLLLSQYRCGLVIWRQKKHAKKVVLCCMKNRTNTNVNQWTKSYLDILMYLVSIFVKFV